MSDGKSEAAYEEEQEAHARQIERLDEIPSEVLLVELNKIRSAVDTLNSGEKTMSRLGWMYLDQIRDSVDALFYYTPTQGK